VIPRINAVTGKPLWSVDRAVLLPGDIEIVLDNCCITQSPFSFDNIFRTEGFHDNPEKDTCGIHIRGIGNAVLDGGTPNGLTERTARKDGYPNIIWNNTILLNNVRNFTIENLTIKNQRWWGINLYNCSFGRLSNLTFDAKDNIPNQDGIDLRVGCHDIIIENIFGQGGDDLIALSGFRGTGETRRRMLQEGRSPDIYNVVIRNVVGASVSKAIIALRNHDGVKLRNITIDGVHDISSDDNGFEPYAAVRIGQKYYFHDRKSIMGETSNIRVTNIHASRGFGVLLNVTLSNSSIDHVYCGEKALGAVRTSYIGTSRPINSGGVAMKNVTIDNIYSCETSETDLPLIWLHKCEDCDTLENVVISNVFGEFRCNYENGYVLK